MAIVTAVRSQILHSPPGIGRAYSIGVVSSSNGINSRTWLVAEASAKLTSACSRRYANAIRSLSRGRASYSMTPSHFERVPDALATKIVKASAK